jgi:hypothetical protein
VHKPFNRYDDKSLEADLNVVFAWQSGHRPLQRGTTYGLDGAYPTQLQPALLRAYEWASTRWHEFLRQPSKVMPCLLEMNLADKRGGQGVEALPQRRIDQGPAQPVDRLKGREQTCGDLTANIRCPRQ